MSSLSDISDIYEPKHLFLSKELIYARRSKTRAIDLKILYHILYFSMKNGGEEVELLCSEFSDVLKHGIHTNSQSYLNQHQKEIADIYDSFTWIVKNEEGYEILKPIDYYFKDEKKVRFKINQRFYEYLSKDTDGISIDLSDFRPFRNTGLAFNMRLYEILKYEASKTSFKEDYVRFNYPDAVLLSGRVDISDEKYQKYYINNIDESTFVYEEKLYDDFNTSMANLRNTTETAVNELNKLSSTTGFNVEFKAIQQDKWVNRGIKLDGFIFKIISDKNMDLSLDDFLQLSRKLDEKFSPNELAEIIMYQQSSHGCTLDNIVEFYKQHEKSGRKRLLDNYLKLNVSNINENTRGELISLWDRSKNITDGRFRN